jgi:hypothetical protein
MLHIIYWELLNSDPDPGSGSRENFPDPDSAKWCRYDWIQIRNTVWSNTILFRIDLKMFTIVFVVMLWAVKCEGRRPRDLVYERMVSRVETKMNFMVFAKMQKSCEIWQIFAKIHEISFCEIFSFSQKFSRKSQKFFVFAKIFAKGFVIFVYFRIFAKTKIDFWENSRENAKTKIFVSTLMVSK